MSDELPRGTRMLAELSATRPDIGAFVPTALLALMGVMVALPDSRADMLWSLVLTAALVGAALLWQRSHPAPPETLVDVRDAPTPAAVG